MSSPGAIPFHPLADLFPLIEGPEFEALCEDIRTHGLRHPIQLWNGQIVDGRNRYRAMCVLDPHSAGRQAWAAKSLAWFEDVSHIHERLLPAHVVSLNLRRRHLDETQRAMIAARLATMPVGRPAGAGEDNGANLPDSAPAGVSVSDAAGLLNVSPRSVKAARALRREAPAEIVQQAERGEVSLHGAKTGLRAAKQELARRGEDVSPEALSRAYDLLKDQAEAARQAAKDRKKAIRAAREQQLAGRIASANAALAAPQRQYGVILADPEWAWDTWSEAGKDRSPENHYPLSATEVIAARPVVNLAAPDCVLFLWATAPRLPDALAVMAAWGFEYKSHCIWRKAEISGVDHNPGKRDRGGYSSAVVLGTGYWFRNAHELLLVGVRGDVPCPAMGNQFPSVIDAPPRRHSEKPERFAELIEGYFPNVPKIELNARRARPGWDIWGAEAPEEEP